GAGAGRDAWRLAFIGRGGTGSCGEVGVAGSSPASGVSGAGAAAPGRCSASPRAYWPAVLARSLGPPAPGCLPGLLDAQASADRAVDPRTGHVYLRTKEPVTVYDAIELARTAGGTLVAVDSAEEESFLLDNFGAGEAYWIGLVFPFDNWSSG